MSVWTIIGCVVAGIVLGVVGMIFIINATLDRMGFKDMFKGLRR